MLYYKNYSELDLYLHKINRNTKFAVVYKKNITAVSLRWRHWIDHADTKQKPLMKPDCLLGVVPQPTDSRLSETSVAEDVCADGSSTSAGTSDATTAALPHSTSGSMRQIWC